MEDVPIGEPNPFPKRSFWLPPEGANTAEVRKFLPRAVRSRRFPVEAALLADDVGDQRNELTDGDVRAGANVDHRRCVRQLLGNRNVSWRRSPQSGAPSGRSR